MRYWSGAFLLACCGLCQAQADDGVQRCGVRVANDWIEMGHISLAACVRLAREAAIPGQTQMAHYGDSQLQILSDRVRQSTDGGRNWQPLAPADDAVAPASLNVLLMPESTANPGAASANAAAEPAEAAARQDETAQEAAAEPAQATETPASGREPASSLSQAPAQPANSASGWYIRHEPQGESGKMVQ